MKYKKALFKDLKKGTKVALPLKNKSFYLTNDGLVNQVYTARLFDLVDINENKSSGTFTAELMEIGYEQNEKIQPLIFEPDTEVFEVFDDEPKVEVKEDKRKVIKG